MTPGRVLFVVTGLEYGGAEMQVWLLSRELRERGWSVDVVSMIPAGPMAERFRADGTEVRSLEMRRGLPSPGAIARLARIVRADAPTVVHSHMVHANLLTRAAHPFWGGAPLLNSGHNTSEGARWRYWAYRATDRWCDRFHTVSRSAMDVYARGRYVSPVKLFHLPNGVPTGTAGRDPAVRARVREELALDDFTFLHVCRLEPAKDTASLLRAFARVRERAPATLLVAGTGSLAAELCAQAGALGLAASARFLGTRDDVPDLMQGADAFVLSSRWEGLPVTVLEAGLAELPLIATAVGDLSFVVDDETRGVLVEPGNVDALADAMERVRGLDPSERAALGANLRAAVVERCDLGRVVDVFEAVYAELAAR